MPRTAARLVVLPLACLIAAPLPALPAAAADEPDVTVTAVVREPDGGLGFVSRSASSASAGARLADALEDQAGVLAAEVDGRVRALGSDPHRPRQWGLDRLQAEQLWPAGDGTATVVAVLDTGVDGAHVDLAGQVLPPIDLVEPSATRTVAVDPQGHGTHVAGVVAAATGNDLGVAGLAPGARVLPVRVLAADGTGSDADLAEGIVRAVDAGADVLNLSLGGPRPSSVLAVAVDHALRHGVVVVAAAGNSGAGGPVEYPAGFPGVLGVAAVDQGDQLAAFSTPGPHVDLAAPGQDILSTYPGNRLAELDGTSMAVPFVAGAAALLVSGGLDRRQVAERLTATAQDLGPVGRDDRYGAGLVDVRAARAAAVSAPAASSAAGSTATASPGPSASAAPAPGTTPPAQQTEPAPGPVPPASPSPRPQPTASPGGAAPGAEQPASSGPTTPPAAPSSPSSPSPVPSSAPSPSAAPRLSARISVSARTITAGQAVTVSARALRDGRAAAGVPVRLERSTGGGWSSVRTGVTGADGLVSWALRPDRSGAHRVRVDGGLSPEVLVAVRQRLTGTASRTGWTGAVAPAGRATVVLERRTGTGWTRVARLTTASDGRYRGAVRLARGTVVRATVAARSGVLSGSATPLRIR